MNRTLAVPRIQASWLDAVLVISASLVVAAAAQVAVPLPWTPVPVTLQPLAVLLVGAFLGPWRGAAAMTLYLLEGAAGLPVFTPVGAPGAARLLGPTGGYLMSFPVAAFLIGSLAQRGWTRSFRMAFPAFLGTSFVILASGAAWMAIISGRSLEQVLWLAVIPFLPWDILKVLFAASLTSLAAKGRR